MENFCSMAQLLRITVFHGFLLFARAGGPNEMIPLEHAPVCGAPSCRSLKGMYDEVQGPVREGRGDVCIRSAIQLRFGEKN